MSYEDEYYCPECGAAGIDIQGARCDECEGYVSPLAGKECGACGCKVDVDGICGCNPWDA